MFRELYCYFVAGFWVVEASQSSLHIESIIFIGRYLQLNSNCRRDVQEASTLPLEWPLRLHLQLRQRESPLREA
jgi:hypothetical protein